jgi:hypothetical protein
MWKTTMEGFRTLHHKLNYKQYLTIITTSKIVANIHNPEKDKLSKKSEMDFWS